MVAASSAALRRMHRKRTRRDGCSHTEVTAIREAISTKTPRAAVLVLTRKPDAASPASHPLFHEPPCGSPRGNLMPRHQQITTYSTNRPADPREGA